MNRLPASEDTIVAIASAQRAGLRGIVRIAGPQTAACLAAVLTDAELSSSFHSFPAELELGEPLGAVSCTVLHWPDGRSYTGGPQAEIHLPAAAPVLSAAVGRIVAAGARLARPGEFTLRAFLAGRIDLTRAEAVLGVIDSESSAELAAALEQLAGGMATPLRKLREQLFDLLARLEAGLDFVDEDIEFIQSEEISRILSTGSATVEALLAKLSQRGGSEELSRVVLWGAPNVGKSSLFNALIGGEGALVSPTAGTTRDYLEHTLAWPGCRFRLIDTAGLHAAEGQPSLESDAQRKSREQFAAAHVRILCLDGSRQPTEWELAQLAAIREQDILLLTKADQPVLEDATFSSALRTSSRTGAGLEELRAALHRRLVAGDGDACVAGTALRCCEALAGAAAELRTAEQALEAGWGEEIVAAEIRSAIDKLGLVLGAVYTDDLLDRIFSRFCIGK